MFTLIVDLSYVTLTAEEAKTSLINPAKEWIRTIEMGVLKTIKKTPLRGGVQDEKNCGLRKNLTESSQRDDHLVKNSWDCKENGNVLLQKKNNKASVPLFRIFGGTMESTE